MNLNWTWCRKLGMDMVFRQCGWGYELSDEPLEQIERYMYHIYMVFPHYEFANESSSLLVDWIERRKLDIYMVCYLKTKFIFRMRFGWNPPGGWGEIFDKVLPFSFFSVFDDFGEWLWWWSLQLWLWLWLCLVSISILTDCLLLAGCSHGRSTFFFISFWSRNALYAWMFWNKLITYQIIK